MTAADFYRLS